MPSTPAASSQGRMLVTLLALAFSAGLIARPFVAPLPAPAPLVAPTDPGTLGKKWGVIIREADARGRVEQGKAIVAGKAIKDSLAVYHAARASDEQTQFAAKIAPGLALVIAPGTEPADQAQRIKIQAWLSAFAAGETR